MPSNTKIPIKGLPVDEVPLRVECQLPAHGYVRTPMFVTFEIHNRSLQLMQLDMNMDASEAFMFAGYKQVGLPHNYRKFRPKTILFLARSK